MVANGGILAAVWSVATSLTVAQAPTSTRPPSTTSTRSEQPAPVTAPDATATPGLIDAPPERPDEVLDAFSAAFKGFRDALVDRIPYILAGLVIVVASIYLGRLLRGATERALRRTSTEAHVHLLVGKVAYFGTILVGLIVALAVNSVNLTVLVGSLGLASVGIGFALSDILGNFVAGIALLLERPFTRGDYIITQDAQGEVMDIRVRATVLRTPDGQTVLIPNKLLFTGILTNASATSRRRLQVDVNVPYTEDSERTRELLLAATAAVDGVEEEPAPQIMTQDFGQGALRLMLWFWVDPRTTDMLRVRSQVMETIESTLREADVDLAVPTLMASVPMEELERQSDRGGNLKPTGEPADPGERKAVVRGAETRTGEDTESGRNAPSGTSGPQSGPAAGGGVQEQRKE